MSNRIIRVNELVQREISDILRNPKTPMRILAKHFETPDPQAQWGLALNPMLPVAVMEKFAAGPDRYVRFNLTYNPSTPLHILEKLASDPDATLATHATQAIERKSRLAAPAFFDLPVLMEDPNIR